MERTFKDMKHQDFRPAIKRMARFRLKKFVFGRCDVIENSVFFKSNQLDIIQRN